MNRTTMARATMLIALIGLVWTLPVRADDPDNCLLCHQYRGLSRLDTDTSRLHLFFTDPDYSNHRRGPHARLGCTDCHVRAEVSVIPHQTVTPVDCARACHLGSQSGIAREFSHAHVKGMLQDSAHKPDTLLNLQFNKGPLLSPEQANCLYCHDEPVFRDPSNTIPIAAMQSGRTFDRCDVCHTDTVPLDVVYYLRHVASRLVPARPPLELAQVCAVCHSDPLINKTHEMKDSVAGFVRSFHGKAALLGDQSTANCLSCHVSAGDNAHRMLGRNDPKSSVNPVRLADSCRSTECHPGADKSIAATAVHLDLPTEHGSMEYLLAVTFIVLTILTFGPSALLVLLELFQIVVGREHHGDGKVRDLATRLMADPRGRERLKRFKPRHRVQHWILTILFTLLVLTGFPMKFADRTWAAMLVQMFGGLQVARVIHHWSGIFLVIGFIGHMVDVFFVFLAQARSLISAGHKDGYTKAFTSLPMWISPTDVKKTFQLLACLMFLRKERPTFGRFSPAEKFEYLGVFWGTMLLGITGAILWGEQYMSHLVGGRIFNLSTIAHTYEAFLAVIHVGILHIYNVILAPRVFPLSPATITGHTPMDKLVEEHSELVEEVARDLGLLPQEAPHESA
ncbi:MAG: hypothetical protein AABZ08_01050 [Planctomycetota bacterium]